MTIVDVIEAANSAHFESSGERPVNQIGPIFVRTPELHTHGKSRNQQTTTLMTWNLVGPLLEREPESKKDSSVVDSGQTTERHAYKLAKALDVLGRPEYSAMSLQTSAQTLLSGCVPSTRTKLRTCVPRRMNACRRFSSSLGVFSPLRAKRTSAGASRQITKLGLG